MSQKKPNKTFSWETKTSDGNNGLKPEVVDKLNSIFAVHPTVQQVILYESRAMGNYKPGSDIDLTLKGKELNLDTINQILIEIDDLLLPYTIDLSILSHISNNDLLDHIKQVGVVFYNRE